MATAEARAVNLSHLLDLASVYKGLNRKQLADALGRDPTKIFPPTGNPKLDYLMRLAELLDWPVGDVVEAIRERPAEEAAGAADFEELNQKAKEAHQAGRSAEMVHLADLMHAVATTPEQRALAAHREAGGWDGLGRYTRQLDAIRRGLREGSISMDLRVLLQVNLANTYYTLWHLLEARAMARDLIDAFAATPPRQDNRNTRSAQAFAYYVLGSASLRLATQEPEFASRHARAAKEALEESLRLYTALTDESDRGSWRGIANTCRGGVLEARVELGEVGALEAVAELSAGLDQLTGPQDMARLAGDRLESFGWWCVFGCNIALRHLTGRDLQRHMAVFTNKGYEIADRLDNWAMRERLFTMEFLQRQQLNDLAGFPVEWTIDNEEVKILVGTMGRFPAFRSTGWRILQTATVVRDN
jgi:hypothetical protein